MTIRFVSLGALALAGALASSGASAQNTQVGTIICDVSPGLGLIITSQKEIACDFRNSRGEREVYGGVIRKFGLDIGRTSGGQLVWSVFAPSGRVVRGALTGNYVGATAEATVGGGVGANVLVGGSDRSIALQPVSVQGQSGLNIAAGVAELQLRYVPPPPGRR